MVKNKNRGPRANTRASTRKSHRVRGKPNVNKYMQHFEVGDVVHVKVDSSVHKGMPYKRFWGKTGEVVGRQGGCYVVAVDDLGSLKEIVVGPVHLIASGGQSPPMHQRSSASPHAQK